MKYNYDDLLDIKCSGQTVEEHTKSSAGDRSVYVPAAARKIVNQIIAINEEYGLRDEDYLFVHHETGKRMFGIAMSQRLTKYCRYANIPTKSMHKIRKTYISALIDNGLNINEISKQVGHEDERTTYYSYCFNRLSSEQTEQQIEMALCNEEKQVKQDKNNKIVLFEAIKGNQKVCSTK